MMHPDVLTTGQVARICRISQQSVIRCADDGTLKCFRVPGSTHRRVMVQDVRRFMTENNIPVEWLEKIIQPFHWYVVLKSTGRSKDSS